MWRTQTLLLQITISISTPNKSLHISIESQTVRAQPYTLIAYSWLNSTYGNWHKVKVSREHIWLGRHWIYQLQSL